MTAKWTGYFKVVTPQPSATKMTDSQEMADVGAYNNYTWYQRLIQGSASRMTRYREYDLMDNDIEVARALDTIAEEMTGNNPKTKEPLILDILTEDEDNVESVAVLTLKAALRRWGQLHDFPNRLYNIARLTVKYGDLFFRKGKKMTDKWQFIHPKNVVAAVVSEHDATKVMAWQIKKDIQKPRSGGYAMPIGAKQDTQMESEIVPAEEIIRFSLNDDMADTQPFGESVLRPVYRSHKQKELLEDAVIIYRVQRAPERRVFYIDVGKMPPQRVKQYLEGIKNEIKQKKIPTLNGGQQEVDSVYNPHSMSEDFYFACMSMKTKVFLLDGRTLSIDELRQEFEEGKENWTYSIDQKSGKLIPGKIDWAGYTRRNAEMMRVYLDNGETIDVTPDHKFVLKDGSEVEAQNLTTDMSLMPLYKKRVKTNKKQQQSKYEMVLDNSTGKWKFTHLEIMPKLSNNTVIHHCDYNPSNNSPTNLVEMDTVSHWELHSKNGHTFGELWKNNRQKMLDGIRKYHDNRTPKQNKILSERNKRNGANTWKKHEIQVRANLKRANQQQIDSFDNYEEYCSSMSDMAKIQWTDEKRAQKSIDTIEFNKLTKIYNVDDKLYEMFLDEYNDGNTSMSKIKFALRRSDKFKQHFKRLNKNNQNVKNNKSLNFGDKLVYKIVRHAGFENFADFKENYSFNHKIIKVEMLPYREDTGCLHVIDPDDNHNFALEAGVYVKNSRPDGRGSRVETLPGGQGLGELSDLEFFQRKVWRGLKVPVSYMIEQQEGGQIWNDGKVGIAYIQELRFSSYIERLQGYLEKTIDEEFKKFLRKCNIRIDESTYRIMLPPPSNFGKYRQLELDSQLLSAYTTPDGINYLSKRFSLKRYLQMSDEEIITNERLKREELGIDPDSDDPNDLQLIYGNPEEQGALGGGAGAMGGGFGGAELGMGGMPTGEPGAQGEQGTEAGTPQGTPPAGPAPGTAT